MRPYLTDNEKHARTFSLTLHKRNKRMLRTLCRSINKTSLRTFSTVRYNSDADQEEMKRMNAILMESPSTSPGVLFHNRKDWAVRRREEGKPTFDYDQDAKKKDFEKQMAPILMGEEKKWREGKIADRSGLKREQYKI
jgi:outer membrane cobalamin receptor